MPLYTNAKMTIKEYVDQLIAGIIKVDGFQRKKGIHTHDVIVSMITAILAGYKIPAITLARYLKSLWSVDGLNRGHDFAAFMNNEVVYKPYKKMKDFEKKLFAKEFSGKTFKQFEPWAQKIIMNHILDVVIMTCTREEARNQCYFLNSGTPQNRAEKDHVLRADNPITTTINKLSSSPYWVNCGISTNKSHLRMGTEKLVTDLVALIFKGVASESRDSAAILMEYNPSKKMATEIESMFSRVQQHVAILVPDINKTRFRKKGDYYTLFQVALTFLNENKKLINLKGAKEELSIINDCNVSTNHQTAGLAVYYQNAVQGNDHKNTRENRFDFMKARLSKHYH